MKIDVGNALLFESGSATLRHQAKALLLHILDPIKNSKTQIEIEGHTDNVPIHTPIFPSNWELSGARASAVASFFAEHGVQGKRLMAIGCGEYYPIASNDTEAGRQKNRRIVVVLTKGQIYK